MQYIFDINAGNETLKIDGDNHKYLFKVRRAKIGENINLRNLEDDYLYTYTINSIDKRSAALSLEKKEEKSVKPNRYLHLGWCIIDPKNIEKTLPSLNELGISKISFIYSEFSQKNFKINLDRIEKILINSSIQCGRSDKIEIEILDDLKEFKTKYPKSYMFNFSTNKIADTKNNISSIVVGPEGGFSKNEIEFFEDENIVGIDSNIILRSETAVAAITSLVLY